MKKFWIVPIFLITMLIGCSPEASLDPVSIDQDVASCAACNMGINDTLHATQVVFEDSEPDIYDDIGCMIIGFQEDEANIGTGYVKDYNSDEWIDMNDATYVQENDISTPMSYGIIAFQSNDDAESFQAENDGDIYDFDELLQFDIQDLKHESGQADHDQESDSHE